VSTNMTAERGCNHCGAGLLPDARYCRQCGSPVTQLNQGSVTESTTQLLDRPESTPILGHDFPSPGGKLEYQPPQTSPSIPARTTTSLERASSRRQWSVAILLVIAFIGLIAIALVFKLEGRRGAGFHPPGTAVPAVPPPAPPAPPAAVGGANDPALIYPGAKKTMQITSADDGNLIQLESEDPVDQVAAWYKAKLKPRNVLNVPGANVILETDEFKVIITTAGGDKTNILLKQGSD
jgi:hypothetical protein